MHNSPRLRSDSEQVKAIVPMPRATLSAFQGRQVYRRAQRELCCAGLKGPVDDVDEKPLSSVVAKESHAASSVSVTMQQPKAMGKAVARGFITPA